MTNKGAES